MISTPRENMKLDGVYESAESLGSAGKVNLKDATGSSLINQDQLRARVIESGGGQNATSSTVGN